MKAQMYTLQDLTTTQLVEVASTVGVRFTNHADRETMVHVLSRFGASHRRELEDAIDNVYEGCTSRYPIVDNGNAIPVNLPILTTRSAKDF